MERALMAEGSPKGLGMKQRTKEATMPSDGSSLAVAQRPSFNGYPLRSSVQETALRTAPPPASLRAGAAGEANKSVTKKKAPPPRSAAGFLLPDASLYPISFNAEAI